jgi:hypothetical protein
VRRGATAASPSRAATAGGDRRAATSAFEGAEHGPPADRGGGATARAVRQSGIVALEKESSLRSIEHRRAIVQVVKKLAAEINRSRRGRIGGAERRGGCCSPTAALAPGILGTCQDAVEQGIQQMAANVLVIEYRTTLQQTKNMLGRFVKASASCRRRGVIEGAGVVRIGRKGRVCLAQTYETLAAGGSCRAVQDCSASLARAEVIETRSYDNLGGDGDLIAFTERGGGCRSAGERAPSTPSTRRSWTGGVSTEFESECVMATAASAATATGPTAPPASPSSSSRNRCATSAAASG